MDYPRIPHYEIIRLEAEGGTARLFFGVDLRSGFPVAIKELKQQHYRNQKVKDEFVQEAQVYLYLQHPNIPRLVDFAQEKGLMYVIMEWVDGETLQSCLFKQRAPLPQKTALQIFCDILDTVDYAHRKGFLHLDIKSNNIMFSKTGSVKVLDFGIASKMRNVVTSNSGFGTPAYMPIEQQDKGGLGPYTDVFALGVLLFELLTTAGPNISLPFQGRDRLEIRRRMEHHARPNIQLFNPRVSNDLQPVFERAVQNEPQKRFQSCSEFKDAVTNILQTLK